MRVDVQSFGTVNRLAREGSEAATASLSQLTGIDAAVDVTRITLMNRGDVGGELRGTEAVGVRFDLTGGLEGDAVLAFDADSAETVAGEMLPGAATPAMVQSCVEELGNVMMSGFVDGWADYLETTIEHSPPEYVAADGPAVLPDPTGSEREQRDSERSEATREQRGSERSGDPRKRERERPQRATREQVFVFASEIEWVGQPVNFYIYVLPEQGALTDLMTDIGDGESEAVPVDKLEVFNEMTRAGTATAADNVEMMTGIPTEAEVTGISFAPVEDVPRRIGSDTYVGTVVELSGTPSGFLLVLFDEASALTVAEALMPTAPDGEGVTDRHRAAIEELGNVVTSGFVDGWANVLQTTIDHSPPELVHDMGQAIVDPLAAQVGRNREHAFVVDATMRTDDVEFASEIHALPDGRGLREALEALDVERADQTEADADALF
ncbi:chemotaxis protein CheC [Halomicrobium urmianum]|uniref:chemotaxis protein CheC n=1 Tax=Halomicrobium urmianum TaxID=1586233 RepID=UPI001CD95CC8|nr:chemotaxis protein CheC [Halomicrobium urmianum]